jgi:FkbM family methyltransferase
MDSKKLNIAGVMTTGRYCNSWAIDRIYAAFMRTKIPLNRQGGVFYGQCMQNLLEGQVDRGVDMVITVDGDSVFTSDDIMRLIQVATENEHIDALASLQCRRGAGYPLLGPFGDFKSGELTEIQFDGGPLRVRTAHFGLTAIKLNKLKDSPKPWFFSQPGETGSWDEGRIDDDIWFWRQWEKAGFSVYVDSSVSIGHVEEMVSLFDENGQHKQIYLNAWDKAYLKRPKKEEKILVYVGPNCTSDVEAYVNSHDKSYLFEPLPQAAQILRDSVQGDCAEVIEAACSSEDGWADFHEYNNGMSSSLLKVHDDAKDKFGRADWKETTAYQVKTINLGKWLDDRGIGEIETLVTDAQGMDLEILKTLEARLKSKSIKSIRTESDDEGFQHYQGFDNSLTAQREFMESCGYCPVKISETVTFHPDVLWKPINENSEIEADVSRDSVRACAPA